MDYQTARKHMVNSQVRPNDVTDFALQQAMEAVPREVFLPGAIRDQAYVECEHSYGEGAGRRVMLKARDFAKLVDAAGVGSGELVLDIACGMGYSSAILARLAEMVVAVEPDEALRTRAQDNLATLKIDNIAVVEAALEAGVPDQGPFDLIFIGAGIARQPTALLNQLKDGGRLVAIWHQAGHSAKGALYTRQGTAFTRIDIFDAGSGAVLDDFAAEQVFQF